jgi:hypothetical protein
MKKILLIILLLFQITLFSQEKLKGNYCTIPIGKSDITCFDFKENSRFLYSISGCLGTEKYGNGTFKLENSILILTFDNIIIKDLSKKIQTSKIDRIHNDSIIHKFKFIDIDGEKIKGVNLLRKTEEFNFSGEIANEKGEIRFSYLSENVNENYEASLIGYETLKFKLPNDENYEIIIVLEKPKPILINGEKKIYEFEKVDSGIIKIQGMEYRLRK